MDATTFDRLSKMLSSTSPRRRVLGLLASLPLVGLLTTATDDLVTARGRKSHRHQAHHQHGHAKTQRRQGQRKDAHAEACIPTGQACPSKKPRGKRHKKLSCNACCQGVSRIDTNGKRVCGCQPNGGSCTTDTAASCCSGFCNGATCQAAPCSASIPCPPCQTCNSTTGLCGSLPDGMACDDGNACTQGDTCHDGVCQSGSAVVCASGQHCISGSCVCDATSCAAGCCAESTCLSLGSQSDTQCGSGGDSCQNCTSLGHVCGGGGTPGACGCETDAEACAGQCGTVQNNCGHDVTCSPCPPSITSFTANPTTIDRGSVTPETATLAWATTNATSCNIDNAVGNVPCTGNLSVGPSITTTYTLSASGAGGGPVTAQATVTVQYCHSVTFSGGACQTGATEFCRSQPINATSSADAQAACDTCFGSGTCVDGTTGTGAMSWTSGIAAYTYSNATSTCNAVSSIAGYITTTTGCTFLGLWAP